MESSARDRYDHEPSYRRGCGGTPARLVGALLAISFALWLGVDLSAHAAIADPDTARLYRFKDEHGHVAIANAVPADRVAGGYEVLDAHGQVLETVAPQLGPQELVEKEARDHEAEVCHQNVERVTALYGSVHDIEAAQLQAERALDARIKNLEAGQALERRRLEERQQDAAQRERTGRVVTPDLQQGIEHSRAQIDAIGVEMAQRRQERAATGEQFAEERRLYETGKCEPSS